MPKRFTLRCSDFMYTRIGAVVL